MSEVLVNPYNFVVGDVVVYESDFTPSTSAMAGGMYGITYTQSGNYISNTGTGATIIGQDCNKITFYVKSAGTSQTGTLYARVYTFNGDPNAPSGDSDNYEFGSMDISTIGTTGEYISFTNSSSDYTIQSNDTFCLWWNGSSFPNANALHVLGKAPFSTTGLYWTEYNTSEDWNVVYTSQGYVKIEKLADP